jgi:hypothetical protein
MVKLAAEFVSQKRLSRPDCVSQIGFVSQSREMLAGIAQFVRQKRACGHPASGSFRETLHGDDFVPTLLTSSSSHRSTLGTASFKIEAV